MESQNHEETIDLFDLARRFWKALRSLWILVLALAIVFGGFLYLRAKRNFSPVYESRALFSVTSGYGEGDIFTYSQYYDSAAAQDLVDSFPHLLSTDVMKDQIMAKLGKTYINGSISAESIADTNLFQVKVRSSSAQDAYDILCAVIECYPNVAVYMVDNPLLVIREEPILPTSPTNSFSGSSDVFRGILLGLALGMILVAAKAMLTQTILCEEDLKKAISLPILASVPHAVPKPHKTAGHSFLSTEDDSRLDEVFRSLRTRVRKQLADKDGKVVLLTSTVPSEGKSTISANLALSLASEGHRVVLLDADLRNQTIFRMFGSGQGKQGLMALLRHPELNVSGSLTRVPGTSLSYLSGSSTNKRHYSIDSKSVRRVLDILKEQFDYVIVDSPPCGLISDAAVFSRYADCLLYVVRQDHASQGQILDAIDSLYQRNIPLTGCILNDVPRSQLRRSKLYRYGYGYGKRQNTPEA